MIKFLSQFRNDDSGATAVEYGLLVALIAAVIVSAVAILGTDIHAGFTAVCAAMVGAGIQGVGPC